MNRGIQEWFRHGPGMGQARMVQAASKNRSQVNYCYSDDIDYSRCQLGVNLFPHWQFPSPTPLSPRDF